MNKRQIKVELLHASDEVLRQTYDKTLDKQHLSPIGEFIGIVGDAIDQSLKFYDRPLNRDPRLQDPKCNSLKVSLESEVLSVKYQINIMKMIELLDAEVFMIFMEGIDFNLFFKHLNEFTSDFYHTRFQIDEMDGTIECETRFQIDHLLDHAKKLPQPQKLF